MSIVKKRISTYIRDTLGIDDSETVNDLLREYCVTLQEYLAKIPEYLEGPSSDRLYQAAHSLKGCAGNIGHGQVHELCLQLEDLARTKNFVAARSLIGQLQSIAKELGNDE